MALPQSARSTVIIATAIPISLLGAVALIYFMGYTLNSMTLLALLLLIGIVVDDAIVVLENIFRHREELDPDPVAPPSTAPRRWCSRCSQPPCHWSPSSCR